MADSKERGTRNVAVSIETHEMLRELSFKERRTIRSILDELAADYYNESKQDEEDWKKTKALMVI